MKLLPLNKLGARETSPGVVDFGLFLPWVSANDGNRLWVKVIHERDQFLQDIQPVMVELNYSPDPEYGDYWSVQIDIANYPKPHPKAAWGTPGRYVYRYCLKNPNVPDMIDWIIDPFSREFGVGKLSAFTLGYEPYIWSGNETVWKTPVLNELVMYELMINEFGGDIGRTIALMDYLADLGINCMEVMPVSNVANAVDWGFLPIGYFGVDERFGKRKDFQLFIDSAHQRNISVILDSVYGHTSDNFPYSYVYRQLAYHENPFMGPFAKDYFGESTDFNRAFTRDFYFTVNNHWLDCYHVDGFRYDCVPNYWDGPLGAGYANLTYETYQTVKSKQAETGHWQRFFAQGTINLIQCAEQLEGPAEILRATYSNCTWQNETFGSAQSVAHGNRSELYNLGLMFGLFGYPENVISNNDNLKKAGLQYIENHDHSRFVCNFRTTFPGDELLGEGDRSLWYKVQPYLIGILTAKGIPMLWQGQEFGENYYVPDQGMGRVLMYRPVRWDYFYDPVGKSVISLVRRLIKVRQNPQFCNGDHFFYNDYDRYQSRNVLLFSRSHGNNFSLVALNFGDLDQNVSFYFPVSGDYREELHGVDNLNGVIGGQELQLVIPSNYGRIWSLTT
ncbi:MAG: alpha-amlyase [Nitrospiraceae bacterium]|nr:MAG: alpha-amlyase [Nitrospiraceae bacterium]